MLPKIGFKGWLCKLCGHLSHRTPYGYFECSNKHCNGQYAEWVEVE